MADSTAQKRAISVLRRPKTYTLTLRYLDKPKTDDEMKPRNVASVELPYVSSVRRLSPNALIRSWTNDGIYQEHSGFAQSGFTLSGRSGVHRDDLAKFYSFLNLLDRYAAESKDNLNAFVQERPVQLIATLAFEQERFWVDVVTFEYARTHGTSTLSYEWTLTLVTNGHADRRGYGVRNLTALKAVDIPPAPYMPPSKELTQPSKPATTLDDQLAGMVRARLIRDQAARNRANRALMLKLPLSERTINTVSSALAAGRTPSPGEMATLLSSIDASLLEAYGYYTSIPRTADNAVIFATEVAGLTALLTWLHAGKRVLEALMGAAGYRRTNNLEDNERHTSTFSPVGDTLVDGIPATRVTVGAGRTVHDVAADLGLSDRIRDIMRLNGMSDASTLGNGRAVEPGVEMLVPTRNPLPVDALGTDLAIDINGNLVMQGDDIAVVSGLANLHQNLNHRMRTVAGANRSFPAFGLPALKDINPTTAAATLLTEVEEQVLRDHRVESVDDLAVAEDGGAYAVSFTVVPVTGTVVPVTAAMSESA